VNTRYVTLDADQLAAGLLPAPPCWADKVRAARELCADPGTPDYQLTRLDVHDPFMFATLAVRSPLSTPVRNLLLRAAEHPHDIDRHQIAWFRVDGHISCAETRAVLHPVTWLRLSLGIDGLTAWRYGRLVTVAGRQTWDGADGVNDIDGAVRTLVGHRHVSQAALGAFLDGQRNVPSFSSRWRRWEQAETALAAAGQPIAAVSARVRADQELCQEAAVHAGVRWSSVRRGRLADVSLAEAGAAVDGLNASGRQFLTAMLPGWAGTWDELVYSATGVAA